MTVIGNMTVSQFNDTPTLETLIEQQQEDVLSMALRASLSTGMACICLGSVFGGYFAGFKF